MAFPSVTYTFTNATTADATQVNQNFTDLINGLSDGTKNLNVSALTTAGVTTFNAAVTIGASTANDVVFNGSLASTIPVKTNTSFDIGTSTLGLRSIYIGGSSTFTVRLIGGTQASSYTLTLPTTAGTTGQFPVTDGSGVLSFRYPDKALAAQSGNVTLTGSETLVPCTSAAGNFTVTLPAAASFTGKRYCIIKTDSDTNLANKVTVAANGAELIGSSNTTTLNTQGECLEIVCDGTGWQIISRRISSAWTTYTMTITGATANPTLGSTSVNLAQWKRIGDSLFIRYQLIMTSAGTAGTGNYLFAIPTGLTIDTTKISTAVLSGQNVGVMQCTSDIVGFTAASTNDGHSFVYDSTHIGIKTFTTATTQTIIGSSGYALSNAALAYLFDALVPIVGWNG